MLVGEGGGCQRGREIFEGQREILSMGVGMASGADWVDGFLVGVFYGLALLGLGVMVWAVDTGVRWVAGVIGRGAGSLQK